MNSWGENWIERKKKEEKSCFIVSELMKDLSLQIENPY